MSFSISTAVAAPTYTFPSHCEILTFHEQPFPVLACSRGSSTCSGFDVLQAGAIFDMLPATALCLQPPLHLACLPLCHLGLLTALHLIILMSQEL